MSVPYPGTGPRRRSGRLGKEASAYIEANLDNEIYWSDVRRHLEGLGGDSISGALAAILNLEWDGTITFDVDDRVRRPEASDAQYAPLHEVADAVLGLGWPAPWHKASRTIFECYAALGGKYRHCDVYWAMHELLKGTHLRCQVAHWLVLDDAPSATAGTVTVLEEEKNAQRLEDALCRSYRASVPHRVEREYLLAGRRADLYDATRKLIIEAKAYPDDVMVLGAITQAMLYRTIANAEGTNIDRVAVLLPGEPSQLARKVVRDNGIDADVIWWDGMAFQHESFA